MREIRTSGLTSGDWKRSGILIVHQPATAPVIDSTRRLTHPSLRFRFGQSVSSAGQLVVIPLRAFRRCSDSGNFHLCTTVSNLRY